MVCYIWGRCVTCGDGILHFLMVCNTSWRYDAYGDGNVTYGDGVLHMVTVFYISWWCFTYGDGNVTRGGGITYRGSMLHIKVFEHFCISKSIPVIINMLPGIILIWGIMNMVMVRYVWWRYWRYFTCRDGMLHMVMEYYLMVTVMLQMTNGVLRMVMVCYIR